MSVIGEIALRGWGEPPVFRETRSVLVEQAFAVPSARKDLAQNSIAEAQLKRLLKTNAWATTVPEPRKKYAQRFISAGAYEIFRAFNTTLRNGREWTFSGEPVKWRGRKDPMDCVEHDHVQRHQPTEGEMNK
jgi:hypothetical protein